MLVNYQVKILPNKFIRLLSRSKNKFVRGAITIFFPTYFLRSFYSRNKGKSWNEKQSCLTLSFDCDLSRDIVAIVPLLDVLSSYSFKTVFACVGKWIKRDPATHMKIIEEGHEILNHTYTHPDNEELNPNQKFNDLSTKQQKEEIGKCHEICADVLGYRPIGFRTPHFGTQHTNSVYGILKELGYKYSSSTIAVETPNFGLPYVVEGIIEFPISGCPKHPFGVFDTWHSFRATRSTHRGEEEFYGLFKELVEIGVKTNSFINVYFDPQDVIKLKNFKNLLDYIEEKRREVWIATYKEIAVWWRNERKNQKRLG